MPDNRIITSTDGNSLADSPEQLNMDTSIERLSPDTQRYFTNSDPMDMAFYCVFGGYRKIYRTVIEKHLGREITKTIEEWVIDYNSRIMNESGCNYIANSLKPLVSPVAITGNMDAMTLYNLWDGRELSIRHALLASVYVGFKQCTNKKCNNLYDIDDYSCVICDNKNYKIVKNPYQYRSYRQGDVTAMILTLYSITANAKEGFKMRELAESFITSVIQKNGGQVERKEGLLKQIQAGFKS